MENKQAATTNICGVRYMVTDSCQYSCAHCAVHGYKLQNKGEIDTHKYWFNEWALVQNIRLIKKNDILTQEDYGFLSSVLSEYYGTFDFTLTGGEALIRKDYEKISSAIKEWTSRAVITTLTKWAPLFDKSPTEINDILASTDRIIVSLDTLDAEEHADLNLPLKSRDIALGWLDKTIEVIHKLQESWKQITLNTVLLPSDKNGDKIRKIIEFAFKLNIRDIKFIELDSPEVTVPYIEEYIKREIDNGLFDSYQVVNKDIDYSVASRKHNFGTVKTPNGNELTVGTCRLTCAQEHKKLSSSNKKWCEDLNKFGSLTVNSTWKLIPCIWAPHKGIDLGTYIKSRDVKWLISAIQNAVETIRTQVCPV